MRRSAGLPNIPLGMPLVPSTWKRRLPSSAGPAAREAVRGYVELDRQPTLFLDVPSARA